MPPDLQQVDPVTTACDFRYEVLHDAVNAAVTGGGEKDRDARWLSVR
jgi:hypothetical protein